MNFLVVGKGGREHAIVKALAQSPSVKKIYALPGNEGMRPEAEPLSSPLSFEALEVAVSDFNIDVVVIGPEEPLVAGLADSLREKGVLVFGPDSSGAALEGSKIFSKKFMEKYGVPTSHFREVDSVAETMKWASEFIAPWVLKADGLAAGKGVFICKTLEELKKAAQNIFEKKSLGVAGEKALLEQFQPGYELSYFVLTNGHQWTSLPMAQDHKKLLNGDEGPNTGGMGTVAPMKIDESLHEEIIRKVVEPTVKGLNEEGFDYRGVVFIGLMITSNGPQVLEYNVRFGDPETQVLLPLMTGDWGIAFKEIAEGRLPELSWGDQSAACVVLAAENYPDSPVKDVEIIGSLEGGADCYLLHAGTAFQEGKWLTNGGRVLNSVGIGETLQSALEKAYSQAKRVQWPGIQMRSDIGKKLIK